jgi:NAD(P)-dependent dehydrogenase (short-subunit alcohol dehydrogenase family)
VSYDRGDFASRVKSDTLLSESERLQKGESQVQELRFDGRSAIVTGAGRGVGRCHALLLAARGAKVVVADLGGQLDGSGSSSEPAEQVVAEIVAAGGTAVACHASVADEAGAASIVQTALESFGRVDIVVNNAGIADPDRFEDLSMARFRRMIEVHYLGTVYVASAAWPHMMAAGYGRIVNTTSEAALGFVPKATSYGGAKGGVLSFTRELALESRKHGIVVNAVAPRAQTRLSGPAVMAKTYDIPEEMVPAESLAVYKPELVSPAVAYLAHESCEFNGEVLVSGGGEVMRVAFVVNTGITGIEITPESVADNVSLLRDLSGAREVKVEQLTGEALGAAVEAAAAE